MSELRFTSNSEEFRRAINLTVDKLYDAAHDSFVQLKETWVRNMSEGHFTGYYSGPTRGTKLRNRSGHLASSIGGRVLGNKLGDLRALLHVGGGRAGYARIQEEGGTVTPQKGTYLTIPLPQAMRPGTGTLKPAAKIRGNKGGGYYTAMGPTFVVERGGRLLVKARRKGGSVVPLYILRRSVKIPPRLGAHKELLEVGSKHIPAMSERLLRILVNTKGAV